MIEHDLDDIVPTRKNKHSSVAVKKERYKLIFMTFSAVFLIAALVFGGLFLSRSTTSTSIEKNKYQAVFLSNGQVYFGKLQTLNSEYMKLTDIFYLQTKAAAASTNPQETSSKDTDIELIKLGSEVHGPSDQMIISKSQILFFENLKEDGTVSKSIVKFHS